MRGLVAYGTYVPYFRLDRKAIAAALGAPSGCFFLTERFPRLADPGPILRRILERFFPQLLVPVQPANRENSTWAMFYSFDQYLWQPGGDAKEDTGEKHT